MFVRITRRSTDVRSQKDARHSNSSSCFQVSYFLSPTSAADVTRVFGILEQSGELYLRSPLDYETSTEHRFDVIARDAGSEASETQVRVTVKVNDVNDVAPRIAMTSRNDGVVMENRDAGECWPGNLVP